MKPLRYGLFLAFLVPWMAAGGQSPDCSRLDAMTRMGQQPGTSASFSLSAIAKAAHAASESGYRLVEWICENWNPDSTKWHNMDRETHAYDAGGNLSEEVRWQWSDQHGWGVSYRTTYSYDATGSKIEALLQGWNDGSQQWESPHLRLRYSYDAAGLLAERILQRWEGTRWDNYTRRLFEYYDSSHEAAGNLYQEILQRWENGEWVHRDYDTFTTYVYVYVGTLRVETQQFEGVGLDLQWRTFYAYDESGNLIEERTEDGDGVNISRATFTYDGAGNHVDTYSDRWDRDGAQWIPEEWSTNLFDNTGNNAGFVSRWWNAEQWENSRRCTYVWEAVAVGTKGDSSVPSDFALSQNYPNPFNPTTTISYALAAAADVTLTVHDVLGRQVGRLVSGSKPPGTYEVSFDAAGLPSGVYFYRLEAGEYVETRQMVVLR